MQAFSMESPTAINTGYECTTMGTLAFGVGQTLALLKFRVNCWCFDPRGYAVANIGGVVTPMHRLLLGLGRGDKRIGDHKNRKKYDNRMKNLRICTPLGNARNVSPSKGSRTGELGIQMTKYGRYNVRIEANGKVHHIGNFDNLEDAKKARKEAEDLYHGEFASHKGDE